MNFDQIFGTIDPPAPVKAIGTGTDGLNTYFKNFAALFFIFGGIAFVIMFLWGAIDMIISMGDKEKVAKARQKINWAIIGLILLSLSFVIFRVIEQVTGLKLII